MKVFKIAAIPGDGIGKEVLPAGQQVLDTAAEVHGGYRFGTKFLKIYPKNTRT